MPPKGPPPVPQQKNWRWATTLNLFLPGAGLIYLGRRTVGALLAGVFLVCMAGALGIFLVGYARYLSVALGRDLMQEGQLEQLHDVFHKRWLIALLGVGLALQGLSIVALSWARKQAASKDGPP